MSVSGTSATAFLFFILAGILALIMRTQLARPEGALVGHDLYNQLFTMHGTVMMFLFAVPAVEAASVYLLPNMQAARDLPFPRLSAYAFWAYLIGGLVFFTSLFWGVAPNTRLVHVSAAHELPVLAGRQCGLVAPRHRLHRDLGDRGRDRDHRRGDEDPLGRHEYRQAAGLFLGDAGLRGDDRRRRSPQSSSARSFSSSSGRSIGLSSSPRRAATPSCGSTCSGSSATPRSTSSSCLQPAWSR